MALDPVQLNLKSDQCWRIHHFPLEIIPKADCSHGENFPLVSSWNLTPNLFHVPCFLKRSLHLCSHAEIPEHGDELYPKTALLKAEQAQSSQPFLMCQVRLPSPSNIFVTLFWTLSSLPMSFFFFFFVMRTKTEHSISGVA